jgi:hypothetical protein
MNQVVSHTRMVRITGEQRLQKRGSLSAFPMRRIVISISKRERRGIEGGGFMVIWVVMMKLL